MAGIAGIIRTDGAPVRAETLRAMVRGLAPREPGRGADPAVWTDPAGAAGLATTDPAGVTAGPGGARRAVCDATFYGPGEADRPAGAEILDRPVGADAADTLDRLAGPFALAAWDTPTRRLLLARDRLGQRPLVWWHGGGVFAFASTPGALLACPEVPRRLNRRALGPYLRFGYVPPPATGFEAVQALSPAHWLIVEAGCDTLTGPRRWWDIPRDPPEPGAAPAAWAERLGAALRRSVRDRLADGAAPAVLLSGGLDSSIVAALVAEAASRPVRTFTARFDEPGWDESAYARAVADRLGTDHAEVRVPPACVEAVGALVGSGVLLADSSALAVHHLARTVRGAVPVAFSGDGGDESFGGYRRHAALHVSERMPAALRWVLARVGRSLPPPPRRKSRWNDARRFLSALDAKPLARYLAWRSPWTEPDLAALLSPEVAPETLAGDPLARWRDLARGLEGRPWAERAMAIDLLEYLPADGLAKVDAAAASHGLEVRSPLLDRRVVALARRMPWDAAWRPRAGRLPEGKRVLREAFAGMLPAAVVRRGKMGFGVPVSRWLAGPYAAWARAVLLDAGARTVPLLRRAAVERLLADHAARRADHGERIWALLCLETWMREFRL